MAGETLDSFYRPQDCASQILSRLIVLRVDECKWFPHYK